MPSKWKHITATGLVCFILFYYTDFIHVPLIDSGIRETSDPERTGLYWWLYSAAQYVREALPWVIISAIVPYTARAAKVVAVFIAAMHVMALVDLLLTGNQGPTVTEPAIIAGGIIWTGAVYLCCWRDSSSDAPRIGKAYTMSRQPRDVVTLLASWLLIRWAGSMWIYVPIPGGAYLYGYSKRTGNWQRRKLNRPPAGYRLREIKAPASYVMKEAGEIIGKPYRLDCVATVRRVVRRARWRRGRLAGN